VTVTRQGSDTHVSQLWIQPFLAALLRPISTQRQQK